MSSLEIKDEILGVSVIYDFATELLRFKIGDTIWLSIARLIIKPWIDLLFNQERKFLFE